jgi:hypothetical protein
VVGGRAAWDVVGVVYDFLVSVSLGGERDLAFCAVLDLALSFCAHGPPTNVKGQVAAHPTFILAQTLSN